MTDDLERTLPAALERLADQAPTGSVDPGPIRRRVVRRRRWLIAAPVAMVVLVASVVTGVTLSRPQGTALIGPARASACGSLETGTPPVWARAGFSGGGYPPFARSRSGNVIALVFGNPLSAPPAADHNNKILWVVRGGSAGGIAVTARLEDSSRVTTLHVPAGPSVVNMPTAGCWQLELRIGSRQDSIDLRWSHP